MGQVMLYAITTLKTFIIHAYSRPYWKSMAWFWGRKAGSAWHGCFCSSSSGKAASPLRLVSEEHLAPSAHQGSQVALHF